MLPINSHRVQEVIILGQALLDLSTDLELATGMVNFQLTKILDQVLINFLRHFDKHKVVNQLEGGTQFLLMIDSMFQDPVNMSHMLNRPKDTSQKFEQVQQNEENLIRMKRTFLGQEPINQAIQTKRGHQAISIFIQRDFFKQDWNLTKRINSRFSNSRTRNI